MDPTLPYHPCCKVVSGFSHCLIGAPGHSIWAVRWVPYNWGCLVCDNLFLCRRERGKKKKVFLLNGNIWRCSKDSRPPSFEKTLNAWTSFSVSLSVLARRMRENPGHMTLQMVVWWKVEVLYMQITQSTLGLPSQHSSDPPTPRQKLSAHLNTTGLTSFVISFLKSLHVLTRYRIKLVPFISTCMWRFNVHPLQSYAWWWGWDKPNWCQLKFRFLSEIFLTK